MQQRQIGTVAIVVGVVAALVALLADPVGIGGEEDTFGWKQVVLLVGGLLVAGAGVLAVVGVSREGPGEPEPAAGEPERGPGGRERPPDEPA